MVDIKDFAKAEINSLTYFIFELFQLQRRVDFSYLFFYISYIE